MILEAQFSTRPSSTYSRSARTVGLPPLGPVLDGDDSELPIFHRLYDAVPPNAGHVSWFWLNDDDCVGAKLARLTTYLGCDLFRGRYLVGRCVNDDVAQTLVCSLGFSAQNFHACGITRRKPWRASGLLRGHVEGGTRGKRTGQYREQHILNDYRGSNAPNCLPSPHR